jgi:hypothetical protein
VITRLLRRFSLAEDPASARRAERAINLVRVAFGLLYAHRCLDVLGFAILAAEPAAFARRTAVELVLALAIASGFLTPLCLGALLALLTVAPGIEYLGMQVARMVAWGLLLSGAGRAWGFDGWALRQPWLARVVVPLYLLAPAGPAGFGATRLLLLALFWSVTLNGVRHHAADPFWLRGEVLQLATTTPYLSDHWALFAQAARDHPRAFDLLCKGGLCAQAFWQAALLPLAFSRRAGVRAFVVLQGLAFFLASALVFNLGYLAVFELCLWGLIFGVAPRFGLTSGGPGPPAPHERGARRVVLATGLLGSALLLTANLLGAIDAWQGTRWDRPILLLNLPFARTFGLFQVNVFNEADLRMATLHPVLLETDAEGRVTRTVPFLDREGGRLDYLRNDLLYYQWSLRWQRLREKEKLHSGEGVAAFSPRTVDLLHAVAALDACVTENPGPRRYRGILMRRRLSRNDRIPVWTQARPVLSVDLNPADLKAPPELPRVGFLGLPACYDLPPGHAGSESRARETLEWARHLPLP